MVNDFVDVNKRKQSISSRLRKELIAYDQKCTKENKPFCYRCAKLAYEDNIKSIVTEALRKTGDVKSEDLKLPKLDLKKFVGKNCFEQTSETDAWEKSRGSVKSELVGYNIDYKCNIRGCGRSIFMSVDEYDVWKGNK